METIKLIECPRDAMQGLHEFIPTNQKIEYINQLIEVGFDSIDFGSFVSPKAIPQMRDTAEVLKGLRLKESTNLIAIIANERGAQDACSFDEIGFLGYPFSVSEQFQQRNTGASIEESLHRVEAIQNLAQKHNKRLVTYLSMGFGNPYGEDWNADIVIHWSERLYSEFGIDILALSDTIGCATSENVKYIFESLTPNLPQVEFGAHMHVRPENADRILNAAFAGGCRRFDSAIKGFGGCPMAKDDLTGNMPTEAVVAWAEKAHIVLPIDRTAFNKAYDAAGFMNQYH